MKYRNGPIGALQDEYEKVSDHLADVLLKLSQQQFKEIKDPDTPDEFCRSVQTVMDHVTSAGYSYSNYINSLIDQTLIKKDPSYSSETIDEAIEKLKTMLKYSDQTLSVLYKLPEEDLPMQSFKVAWGQVYDLEQILEHAIVHIMRHRRQIQKWFDF